MAKPKVAITPDLLKTCEELSEAGSSITSLCKVLGMSTTTPSRNIKVREAIQRGQNKHRKVVTNLYYESLQKDGQNLLATVKRLGIHRDPIPIKKPTSILEARDLLGDVMEMYAQGTVSQSQLKTFESTCKSFVDICKTGELEDEVKKIKDHLDLEGK